MRCCLIFQTLTGGSLARYLPKEVEVQSPGIHPNVATPLQRTVYNGQVEGTSIRKSFADLYRFSDPMIQQYYKSLRKDFYDLPNSDDPVLRGYFSSVFRKNSLAGAAVKRDKNCKKASLGFETTIIKRSKNSGGHFWFYYHDFRLSRSLEFWSVGMIIHVDLDISESQHRYQYAR
jgi:hypothetical protein